MIYKNKNYNPIKPDNKILRTIPETKIIQRPLPNNKIIRAISNNLKQLPLSKKIQEAIRPTNQLLKIPSSIKIQPANLLLKNKLVQQNTQKNPIEQLPQSKSLHVKQELVTPAPIIQQNKDSPKKIPELPKSLFLKLKEAREANKISLQSSFQSIAVLETSDVISPTMPTARYPSPPTASQPSPPVSTEGKWRLNDINAFLSDLSSCIPAINQSKIELKKKIDQTQQNFACQILNIEQIFNQIINVVNLKKQNLIEKYTQQQYQIAKLYQQQMDEIGLKEVTVLQMKNDIYNSYEKIIHAKDLHFKEIIGEYNEKLQLIKDCQPVDMELIPQAIESESIINRFETTMQIIVNECTQRRNSTFNSSKSLEHLASSLNCRRQSFSRNSLDRSSIDLKNDSLKTLPRNKSRLQTLSCNTTTTNKKYQQVIDKIMINQMKKNEYYSKLFNQYSLDSDDQLQKKAHFKKYSTDSGMSFKKNNNWKPSNQQSLLTSNSDY